MKYLSDSALERLREAADAPDLAGTRYRLVDKLGEGGMGAVYRVQDTALERQVALKVLNPTGASREMAARLSREAKIIAQLEHPGIVPVHDVGTLADGRVFYTMKLVQGKRLDRHPSELASLPGRLRVFQKICGAVAFAHAHGVLHRDLKPENIMVGPFGEVLVMDWGLAKMLRSPDADHPQATNATLAPAGAAGATAHGAVLGTPGYMAPEQARGEIQSLDERADVFALGAILQFLLTLENAGGGQTALTQNAERKRPASGDLSIQHRLPRPLRAICQKAMSPEPSARYPGARELARDIACYLDGLPVSAYPEGPLTRLARWISRNRVWVLLIFAYLAMRGLLLWWQGR
jgi:serine/threonine protein kinase